MFAYCGNNPVNRIDATGRSQTAAIRETTNWVLTLFALLDGATPVYEIVALVMAVGVVISVANSGSKKEEKVISDAAVVEPESSDTVIYRYYASRDENLAPRMGIDYDGLSFSTKPPRPGVKAVATTINTVNATGILMAIPTSSSHVIVIPTNDDVLTWMALGHASIWTQVLSMIVIEIEG